MTDLERATHAIETWLDESDWRRLLVRPVRSGLIDLIARVIVDVRRDVRRECATLIDAEPEFPGPMPRGLKSRARKDLAGLLRSTVVATKASLIQRVLRGA
jgi:hypothetical protein